MGFTVPCVMSAAIIIGEEQLTATAQRLSAMGRAIWMVRIVDECPSVYRCNVIPGKLTHCNQASFKIITNAKPI